MLVGLVESFEPTELLYREKEIAELKEIYNDFLGENQASFNAIITGATGTGKTSIIKRVIKELDHTVYIDCKNITSTAKVFKALSGLQRGTFFDYYKKVKEDLKNNKRVLALDEVGTINDPLRLSDALNQLYREIHVPIIAITNQFGFVSKLKEDARKTLNFQKINLSCYDALQLFEILKRRIDIAKTYNPDIDFPEESMRHLCAYVTKYHDSSVRTLLMVAYRCIVKNNFSECFINEAVFKIVSDDAVFFVANRLSKAEKQFLDELLTLSGEGIEIPTLNIRLKLPHYSPSRISQLTNALIKNEVIFVDVVNRGRSGGRYRVINLISYVHKQEMFKILHPERFTDDN